MLLPKAVAFIPFVPWLFVIVVNNLPEEQRLRIQKSSLLQQGTTMRTMKKEPPRVRPARLAPEAAEVAATFKREYPRKDLELLWAALLKCYGSPARALAAVRTNPQMLNPAYSFPNTMLESKRLLLGVMGEEEALEVMALNPAVLQCGPSLASLGKGEIQSFARLRGAGNRIGEGLRGPLLGALLLVFAVPVLGAQNADLADTALLADAKLLAGAVGGPLFVGTILYLLKAGGG